MSNGFPGDSVTLRGAFEGRAKSPCPAPADQFDAADAAAMAAAGAAEAPAAAADAADAAGSAWLASTPCFSPLMSMSPPAFFSTNSPTAAKRMKATSSFHRV